jgi:hypothetical protein
MENTNLIKRFRETYTSLSVKMNDDEVLHWLEHHDEEYEYLAHQPAKQQQDANVELEIKH